MDERTVEIYEAEADAWAAARRPTHRDEARRFARSIDAHALRIDLGSGPGRYTADLGAPVVALDAAAAMLALARVAAPDARCVQADLEHLPFRAGALGAAWACASYLHVARERLPIALAQLHRASATDAPFALMMKMGDYEGTAMPDDTFPGRFFACWEPEPLTAVVEGAGFVISDTLVEGTWIQLGATRARTLPDYVGPGMRVLMCGLNPSLYAADVGVGFARPGNRFWPAALAAGLVTRDRDPWHALREHGVGMTDLVKRASVGAAELTRAEYRAGASRVERLVQWLQPGAVCFVGLAGYRAAVDPKARPGVQARGFGGVPAYVMPNTSGLNTHSTAAQLADHLRAALTLAK